MRIHTMEYYTVIKRNEVWIHATRSINLENIMPGEISQTGKDKYYMIPLILEVLRTGKFIDRKWNRGNQGQWRRGNGELFLTG